MKGEWRNLEWGEIATLEYGKSLRDYRTGAGLYRVFGTNGPIGWYDKPLCTHPGVIVGRKGAYRGIHYSKGPFFVIDTAFYIEPKQEMDLRWAYYCLLTYDINGMDSGSAIPSTSRDAFYRLPVRVPPIHEQQAIAHILGTLDDKIELNRKMNETLEAMARAIFKSWFVDFNPVRSKVEGKQPSGIASNAALLFPNRFRNSELGFIPEGWDICWLHEGIEFLEGPGLRNWQYKNEGMRFLNIRCIVEGDLLVARANCISSDEFQSKYSHFALQEDDIVISTSGTLGRLAIVRSDHLPVMLNTSIIRMRGKHPFGLGYTWGFLQSNYFLEEMFALAAGSVQLNFGPMHLRKIKMLRPPDEVVLQFDELVDPILRAHLNILSESRTLASIRDTLLPKLLSGEIRVKEAERIVGRAV